MADDTHTKALDLTEQALDALVAGDQAKAGKLVEKAKTLDPNASAEIVKEMDEDAASRKG